MNDVLAVSRGHFVFMGARGYSFRISLLNDSTLLPSPLNYRAYSTRSNAIVAWVHLGDDVDKTLTLSVSAVDIEKYALRRSQGTADPKCGTNSRTVRVKILHPSRLSSDYAAC